MAQLRTGKGKNKGNPVIAENFENQCFFNATNHCFLTFVSFSNHHHFTSTTMPHHKHTIVYAEDDWDDVQFVQDCFKKYDGRVDLLHAPNGSEALALLHDLLKKDIKPCLIILDINMPLMDGRQTLVKIKGSPHLSKVPVVLFTTSNSHLDKEFAQKWGADFITKPLRFSEVEGLAEEFVRRCDSEMDKRA
jgi:CheY-like chemotaxis protein